MKVNMHPKKKKFNTVTKRMETATERFKTIPFFMVINYKQVIVSL